MKRRILTESEIKLIRDEWQYKRDAISYSKNTLEEAIKEWDELGSFESYLVRKQVEIFYSDN